MNDVSMSKVAVIFFGLVGSTDAKYGAGSQLDPELAMEYNLRHLILPNKADVFIHTWSESAEEILESGYSPRCLVTERQPISLWKSNLAKVSVFWWLKLLKNSLKDGLQFQYKNAKNSFMRYQSHSRALRLVIQEMEATGVQYDAVIITRLDVAHLTKFELKDIPPRTLVVSNWNLSWFEDGEWRYSKEICQTCHGVSDLWFAFNGQDLDTLADVGTKFFKFDYGQHKLLQQYVSREGFDIDHRRFRGWDFELVRRKFLKSPI